MYEVRPASISEKSAIEITFLLSHLCLQVSNLNLNIVIIIIVLIIVIIFGIYIENKISQIEREATPLIPSLYYI